MQPDRKTAEQIAEMIRHKARQLARRPEFTSSDFPDIVQELFVAMIESAPHYDPERGRITTFLATVIQRKAASLVRREQAARRDAARTVPLCDAKPDRPCEFDDSQAKSRRGISSRDPLEAADLHIDVTSTLADLPDELRALADLLTRESLSQAARDLGQSRTSLYTALRKLRDALKQRHLDEYR